LPTRKYWYWTTNHSYIIVKNLTSIQ
jgi:hypothetical protein